MMNGNCRNNLQGSDCRFGMLNPTNFLTQSIGNFIQNTANMLWNPTQYQNQNCRKFSTNTNHFGRPQETQYTTMAPYATAFVNINNAMGFNPNSRHYNKFSGFNQHMDGMGHRLGSSFNKNNFKFGCDDHLENNHFNQHRNNKKYQKMNPSYCNKNWRDGCVKRNHKTSEKHKSVLNETPESNYTQGKSYCNQRYFNNNNNNKINYLKLENRPNSNRNMNNCNDNNNNNRSAEVLTIFTLDDFPELPVPKRHKQWSFNFPSSCKSKNRITAKINYKNQNESSPKIKSNDNNNSFHEITSNKERNKCNKSSKHDFIEDNFVIIMESPNSPKFKHNTKSTAGFTPFKPRQRQISECSDDSFIICFTNDAADGVIEFANLLSSENSDTDNTDSDDDDVSDDDDDDDDSDNDDVYNKSGHIKNKSQFNQNNNNKKSSKNNVPKEKTENNKTISNNLETLCLETTSQPDSGFDDIKEKKVRFNLEPEVHVMHTWDYAYRAARKGEWESYARDRCRFKNRIDKVGPAITAILEEQHRRKIFNERFSN
ncbi:GATA zinc finger domain-containing protein 14-like [Condylostylus longicornis]|uniref:GATA zinc finger domain-containing protein 14-like n=1 Tax=Condylostylus longicornis TaxID=2530218 RepID=UPI00244DD15D|nr:GATA zinc finger domain-containing protein 14-like [Condylostylus longicornis]